MFSEDSVLDKIEILEDGQIQIRRSDIVFRNGVEIARTYHRTTLAPGQDIATIVEKYPKLGRITNVIWDKTTVDAYTAKVEAAANRIIK